MAWLVTNCYTITLSPPTLVVVAGHGSLYPLLVELGGEVPDLAGHVAVAGDVAVAVVHPGLEHLQYTCTPVQCTWRPPTCWSRGRKVEMLGSGGSSITVSYSQDIKML